MHLRNRHSFNFVECLSFFGLCTVDAVSIIMDVFFFFCWLFFPFKYILENEI